MRGRRYCWRSSWGVTDFGSATVVSVTYCQDNTTFPLLGIERLSQTFHCFSLSHTNSFYLHRPSSDIRKLENHCTSSHPPCHCLHQTFKGTIPLIPHFTHRYQCSVAGGPNAKAKTIAPDRVSSPKEPKTVSGFDPPTRIK